MSDDVRLEIITENGRGEVMRERLPDVLAGIYEVLKNHPERECGLVMFPEGWSSERCAAASAAFGKWLECGGLPPPPE